MFVRTGLLVALMCAVALGSPLVTVTADATVSPNGASVTIETTLAADPEFSHFLDALRESNLTRYINDSAIKRTVFAIRNAAFDAIKAKLNFDKALIAAFLKTLFIDGKYSLDELRHTANLVKQATANSAAQITNAVNTLQQVAVNALSQLQQAITNGANQAQTTATTAANQAGQAATDAATQAGQAANNVLTQAEQDLAQVVANVQKTLRDLSRSIADAFRNLYNTLTAVKPYIDGAVTVAGGIIKRSIDAGNSVVHEIEGAVPPFPVTPKTIGEQLASGSAALRQLADAITTKLPDLWSSLTNPNTKFTFFLPTDAKLANIPTMSPDELKAFLQPYILKGRQSIEDLKHAVSLPSFDGTVVQITSQSGNTLTVGPISVSTSANANIALTNGLVQTENP